MNRLGLYVAGVSAAVAAWMILRNRVSLPERFSTSQNSTEAGRRLPVREAAEMLQHAWSDHHTVV